MIIKYKLYAFFVSLSFANFCFTHESLEELIDKCDFVKFKQTYEIADLSEEQKLELLYKVDSIIEESLNKLKSFFGNRSPLQKDGKGIRICSKIFLFDMGLCLFGFLGSIIYLYKNFNEKLATKNRCNASRSLAIANGINPIRITNLDQAVSNYMEAKNIECYFIAGFLFGSSLLSFASLWLYKWCKFSLCFYKHWKKALTIKKLIQESMRDNSKIVVNNV